MCFCGDTEVEGRAGFQISLFLPAVTFCCAGASNSKCAYFFFNQACLLTPHFPGYDSFCHFLLFICAVIAFYFVEGKRWSNKKKKKLNNLHSSITNVLLFCSDVLSNSCFYIIYLYVFWKDVKKKDQIHVSVMNLEWMFSKSYVDVSL